MWMPDSFSQNIPMKNTYFLSFSLAFTKFGNQSLTKNGLRQQGKWGLHLPPGQYETAEAGASPGSATLSVRQCEWTCFLHENKPYLKQANSLWRGGQAQNLLGSRSGLTERNLERGATFENHID